MKPQKSPFVFLDDIPPVALILVAILIVVAIWMVGTTYAHAETVQPVDPVDPVDNAEMARLPEASQPVALSGRCDRGVAVFSVYNAARRWQERGQVQILDVTTGQVLRERSLIMGQGQTASFRVAHSAWDNPRYRLRVTVPDLGVIYVKTFAGACPAPVVSGR